MSITYEGCGLRLILDPEEHVPSDPGQGTPAMVATTCGRHSGTYFCALDTGELSCGRDVYHLYPQQMAWLETQEHLVADFFAGLPTS